MNKIPVIICPLLYHTKYMSVCGHACGRIFQPIFTKFGKNTDCTTQSKSEKAFPILTQIYRRDRQFPAKC